jgi:hypothetical protein
MTAEPRCYTVAEVLDKLKMSQSTFTELKRAGDLPFLEELQPRLGRCIRYRADLVDRYLRNEWIQTTTATPRRWRARSA